MHYDSRDESTIRTRYTNDDLKLLTLLYNKSITRILRFSPKTQSNRRLGQQEIASQVFAGQCE